MTEQTAVDPQEVHGFRANYFLVFVALCVCTLISLAIDLVSFESQAVLTVLVLAIAAAKALFVMAYFMHLKFEGRWKYVLLGPTLILAIGLPAALYPDISLHYYGTPSEGAMTDAATPPSAETP